MSTDSENVYNVLHPPAYCVNQELILHVETNTSISSVWRLASSFNKLQVDQRSVYTCLCFITGKCWFVYLVLHLYNDGCVEMSWVKRDGEWTRFKELPWSTIWHYRVTQPLPQCLLWQELDLRGGFHFWILCFYSYCPRGKQEKDTGKVVKERQVPQISTS